MSLSDMTSPAVTAPSIPGTAPELYTVVDRMKRAAQQRDYDMMVISLVRAGKPELLFPELFSDVWKKQITANWIDGIAREFAEMIAPLPALNCTSKAMKSKADKKNAAMKNQIGTHYWRESNLKFHMISHADRYLTYGFAPFVVEPHYESNMPRIRVEDPIGAYYENDRYGNCVRYAKCWRETAAKLADQFPEYAHQILTKLDTFGRRVKCSPDEKIDIVRYIDKDQWVMFLPTRAHLVVSRMNNPIDCTPVFIAERPGLFQMPTGQYDQVIWVQLARQRMALLGLEIGVKSAGAPLAIPRDVVEMAVGPDSVIQTDSPEKIRRVGIEVPQSVFALEETLKQEMLMGARYPEGRASGIDASVVTGRGVQALMGSFDSQIQTSQTVIGQALARATAMCFEMDEKVWPHMKKTIYGQMSGEPYALTYIPADAISGDYTCDVSYGYAAGLAPNQAVVMMLQLRGDGLIDRDTVRRNLPFDMNVDQMQRNMDIEQTNDALKQGLFGLLQGVAPLIAQGQDPRPFFNAAAKILKGRQDGKALEDLFIEAFAPESMAEPSQGDQAQQQPPGAPGAPGGDGGGIQPPDQMQTGAAPGMGANPIPGGQPSIQQLVAGLRGNTASMGAEVRRRMPVGA